MICIRVTIKQQKNEKLLNTLYKIVLIFFLFMTTKYKNNVCEDYLI